MPYRAWPSHAASDAEAGGGQEGQGDARPPNAQVAVDLDTSRFWDLIVAAIAALG